MSHHTLIFEDFQLIDVEAEDIRSGSKLMTSCAF